MQGRNYYQVLGVANNAPKQAIRSAYLALAKKYHPDGSKGNSEMFKMVNSAYETLHSDSKRSIYDYDLKQTFTSSTTTMKPKPATTTSRNPFAEDNAFNQTRSKAQYYYEHAWGTTYADYASEEQEIPKQHANAQARYEMYSERVRKKNSFSDAEQKKRASEEDVNMKNSYSRFYKEYYQDVLEAHRKKMIRDSYRRERERVTDRPNGYPRVINVGWSAAQFQQQQRDGRYHEEPVDTEKSTYTIVSVEGLFFILIAMFVARQLLAKDQSHRQSPNTKPPIVE